MPPISQFHRSPFYQTVFSPEERSLGILDQNPSLYFAILLGVKSLMVRETPQNTRILLRRTEDGRYVAQGIDFNYDVELTSNCVNLQLGESKATVYVGSLVRD